MTNYNRGVDEYGVPYSEENWMRNVEHTTHLGNGLPNTHWVPPYHRKDGTMVRGHIAKNPKRRKD